MKHATTRHGGVPETRRALVMMELVIALAFMTLVSGITLKMHQARIDYDRQADDQIRNQMTLENHAQLLAAVPFDELEQAVAEVAGTPSLRVSSDPFATDDANGVHLTLRLDSGAQVLEHHLWRLERRK